MKTFSQFWLFSSVAMAVFEIWKKKYSKKCHKRTTPNFNLLDKSAAGILPKEEHFCVFDCFEYRDGQVRNMINNYRKERFKWSVPNFTFFGKTGHKILTNEELFGVFECFELSPWPWYGNRETSKQPKTPNRSSSGTVPVPFLRKKNEVWSISSVTFFFCSSFFKFRIRPSWDYKTAKNAKTFFIWEGTDGTFTKKVEVWLISSVTLFLKLFFKFLIWPARNFKTA